MAKKKKKTAKKKAVKKKASKEESNTAAWIVIGVILAIGILSVFYYMNQGTNTQIETSGNVAATINGVEITNEEVDSQFARLPPQSQASLTKDDVLAQMIDERILYLAAVDAGFQASEEKIEEALTQLKERTGINDEELAATLESRGTTLEEFRSLYSRQIAITEYLNETVLGPIEIDEDRISTYYDENKASFTKGAEVTSRHVLVLVNEERADEEAMELADSLKTRLDEGENFCDLVVEASEDPGSKDKCGEYTFGKGVMVPEFEEASFRLTEGENEIVKTTFGYHLIEKVSSTEELVADLDTVRVQIEQTLRLERARVAYEEHLAMLKEAATIEYPNNVEEETTGQPTEAKLAACLTAKGAKMYGAYWCGHCEAQKAMFNDYVKDVPYIECAQADDPKAQTQVCQDAGITGYPTWTFADGTKVSGRQSFEDLAELAGCEI